MAANTLKLTKLVFEAQIVKQTALPLYLGNTIRGALGTNALLKMYCSMPAPICKKCDKATACAYGMVFKNINKSMEFPTIMTFNHNSTKNQIH